MVKVTFFSGGGGIAGPNCRAAETTLLNFPYFLLESAYGSYFVASGDSASVWE